MKFFNRFKIRGISCGYGFTIVICENNHKRTLIFGSGINSDTQLGIHYTKTGQSLQQLDNFQTIEINEACNTGKPVFVKHCASGRGHSIFLNESGGFFPLGNNSYGQCGLSVVRGKNHVHNNTYNNFMKLNGEIIKIVECGHDHSIFLTESGKVYSCGWGADGQTGLDTFESTFEPKLVIGDIKDEKIIKISCGVDCNLAINNKGECFGWGNSEYGQLIQNTGKRINSARALESTKRCGKIIDIACGGSFCLALNDDGEVFVWGFGIIGLGPLVDHSALPKNIPAILFGKNPSNSFNRVTAVRAGLSHMGVINENSDIYIWGRNKYGCLGLGHTKNQYFPSKVSVNAFVDDFQCGSNHTLALCKRLQSIN